MCVTDFARAYEFYTTRFNFKPSDVSFCNHFKTWVLRLHVFSSSMTQKAET